MSEEPTPPLRMKPRLSLAGAPQPPAVPPIAPPPVAEVPPASAPEPAASAGPPVSPSTKANVAGDAPFQLKLKPRAPSVAPPAVAPPRALADLPNGGGGLMPPPPPPPPPSPSSEAFFAAPLPLPEPPAPSGASAVAPVVEPAAPDAGSSLPPPPPAPPGAIRGPFPPPLAGPRITPLVTNPDGAPRLKTRAPFPVATPASGEKSPLIHIPAPRSADQETLLAGVKAPPSPAGPPKKKRRGLLAFGAVLLLGVGGFSAYTLYFDTPPPPPPRKPVVAAVPKPTPPPEPLTPSDTLNALAKVPVNAISKAQAAVAGQLANQTERADPFGLEDPAVARPAGTPGLTVANPPPRVMTDTTLSPGLSVSVPDEGVASLASPAFRTFVAEAKVSGVRAGAQASALINGRYVRAGQPVDNGLGLGIVFDGADPATHLITFKDRSGATVTRRY